MSAWKRSGNVACSQTQQAAMVAASSGGKVDTGAVRGWARPPTGYVTIGSLRYGVRFSSEAPLAPPAPAAAAAPTPQRLDGDCCCGVVPLSWPRAAPPPPPPSRLPLPLPLPAAAPHPGAKPPIIRRRMFGRIQTGEQPSRTVSSRVESRAAQQVPATTTTTTTTTPLPAPRPPQQQVYRSTLEWCSSTRRVAAARGGVRSCFSGGEDDTEPEDGEVKMVKERVAPAPPSSPHRPRVLVRSKPQLPAYLTVVCTEKEAPVKPEVVTPRNALERLNRFRFGSSGGGSAERKDGTATGAAGAAAGGGGGRGKKKRSGDKTERLKELTEKLKSPSASSSPDREAVDVAGGGGGGRKTPSPSRIGVATPAASHRQYATTPLATSQQQRDCSGGGGGDQEASGGGTASKFGRQPTYSNQARNKFQQNVQVNADTSQQRGKATPSDERRLTSPDRRNYQQRIEENLRFQQELALEELLCAEERSLLSGSTATAAAATTGTLPGGGDSSVNPPGGGGGVGGDDSSPPLPDTPTTPTTAEDEGPDDLFFLHRPESRTIVGSYTQSKIPYRSASFSQVDYSSVDGKYIRNHARTNPYGGYSSTVGGSHTLPRKRLPDIQSLSNSVSPASSTTLDVATTAAGPTPNATAAEEEVYRAVSVAELVDVFSGGGGFGGDSAKRTEGAQEEAQSLMFATSSADPVRGLQETVVDSGPATPVCASVVGAEDSAAVVTPAVAVEDCTSAGTVSEDGDATDRTTEEDVVVAGGDEDGVSVCALNADVVSVDRTETVEDLSSPWLFALEHDALPGALAANQSRGANYESAEIEKQKQYPVIAKSTVVIQADDVVTADSASIAIAPASSEDNSTTVAISGPREDAIYVTQWPSEAGDRPESRDTEIDYSQECVRQCEEWLKELGEDFQARNKHHDDDAAATVTDGSVTDTATTGTGGDSSCRDEEAALNVSSVTKCARVALHRSAPLDIERCDAAEQDKEAQVANEVAIITTPPQWVDDGSKRWSGEGHEWGSPTEELATRPPWPAAATSARRWPLVYQSSDERDDETPSLSRVSPRRYLTVRTDSFSEGESEGGDPRPRTPTRGSPSLLSPTEEGDTRGIGKVHEARTVHIPRRYSKRPLRGPYGQMLEAEMKKPETSRIFSKVNYNDDLKVFLEEYRPTSPPMVRTTSPDTLRPTSDPRLGAPRRSLATHSLDDSQLKGGYGRSASVSSPSTRRTSPKRKVNTTIPFPVLESDGGDLHARHTRTTSSPSTLDGYCGGPAAAAAAAAGGGRRPEPTPELLAELLRGSSERLSTSTSAINGNTLQDSDTRTHVVVELYDTERNYVEALQILVLKYLQPLKSPENYGLVDSILVDEIFYQVPAILQHHELLLDELRKRLDNWDVNQKIGDVFLDAFTRQPVIETYTSFINNWKSAKEAIKATCLAKPAFARFIQAMAREHKGKLALDNLLIKPVQRIPRYELLIQRLLKHTDVSHPDHALLLEAQKEVHELAVKINCTERESLEYEQQQTTLKELENIIEGSINLVASDRVFMRHDTVTMVSGQGTRKERALFLFSDLLVITSVKRRSGTIRKPSATCPGSVASTLEANKYKLLMRVPLDDLEIVKTKDENLKKRLREMENLTEDILSLNQMSELTAALHCPHSQLEEVIRDMLATAAKQLEEQRTTDAQLSYLELTLNTPSGTDNISVIFTKAEKRNWEESFNDAKQKLALSADRRPSPEFVQSVPIRKTRAGLQFTCAAPTLGLNACNLRDVWVCNSDGYVGQVCVLSLHPEPNVVSCNGVCNARILCVASIPAGIPGPTSLGASGQPPFVGSKAGISISVEDTDKKGGGNIQLDSSSSSSDDEDNDDRPTRIPPPEDELKRARSASDSVLHTEKEVAPPPIAPPDDTDNLQPTMWLGTEDGCIHVYNCCDNIRIKKNKVKIQHGSAVFCIIYLDNRVFVALANGDISVYIKDQNGWNTTDPFTVSVGTSTTPVTRMLCVAGKLWCGCHNAIKILNTYTLEVEHTFVVNADTTRNVTWLATAGLGAWVSLHNSAIIRLFHATTYECLTDLNVAPAVNKMLSSCDDIIRQHKAACLRVTSLLACKDLLWIGTSAGVVLTMPLPHISPSTTKMATAPTASGVPHGHTGHVRFLTVVESLPSPSTEGIVVRPSTHHRYSLKSKPDLAVTNKLLVISGGDGYEDFRTSSTAEVAGREDSTNHLLIWHV